jgi:atypical dual specificity phosphatase
MLNNFSFVLEKELAACAHPDSLGDIAGALMELRDYGIGAIVSLDEDGLPLHLVAEHGFQYLHIPIADFTPPQLQQAEQFVTFARTQQAARVPITVHCRAGYGRTGTMLACYMVAKGRTAAEAIDAVRAARPGSIETRAQEHFVHVFENYLRATNTQLDRRKAKREKKK